MDLTPEGRPDRMTPPGFDKLTIQSEQLIVAYIVA